MSSNERLADAITQSSRTATSWMLARAGAVAGQVNVGGTAFTPSSWIGTPPDAGQNVLLMTRDGGAVAVSAAGGGAGGTDPSIGQVRVSSPFFGAVLIEAWTGEFWELLRFTTNGPTDISGSLAPGWVGSAAVERWTDFIVLRLVISERGADDVAMQLPFWVTASAPQVGWLISGDMQADANPAAVAVIPTEGPTIVQWVQGDLNIYKYGAVMFPTLSPAYVWQPPTTKGIKNGTE